ncbi:Putative transport protein [Halioglobus japonicus]|nr:Putative transport protein [Halioglobus japonicus]
MLDIFKKWYRRYLSDEESVLLLVLLTVSVTLLMTIGDILAPVLASIVLAYLAQGLSAQLQGFGLPRWLGVAVSYLVFVGVFFGFCFALLPLVWRQMLSLVSQMPDMLETTRQFLGVLPERYPHIVSRVQLSELIAVAQTEIAGLGQTVVKRSLASIPGILTVMVYVILIPMLVFFFLKDRESIIDWIAGFLPAERPLLQRIWGEMNEQFANYARGKVLEMLIVGSVSYFAFIWLGLDYAALLGLLVGISVIVPYIGAALVTLPVVMVGFFQWGLTSEFYSMFVVYLFIQVLDGNVLVPLLFSEAVNLHPVAIIMAVLFFGGIWGVWGVFFAIPLATLIKAIINAWPSQELKELPGPAS